MLTKKQIKDLPIGFTPVIREGKGRAHSYHSSTQPKRHDKIVQTIEANKDKGHNRRVIIHDGPDKRLAGFKGCKWKPKVIIKEEPKEDKGN